MSPSSSRFARSTAEDGPDDDPATIDMMEGVRYSLQVNDRGRRSVGYTSAALVVAALLSFGADPSQSAEPLQGDREQGRHLFEVKGCILCHAAAGKPKEIGPSLGTLQKPQGLIELSGRLWNHAPAMQQMLAQRGKAWPTLSTKEMADLAAFFLAKPGSDRQGNQARGQVLLFKKGCLKCHAFFGEGAGVGPDLARYRHYDSPLEWAAGVWDHAPKMRARAENLGTDYPRFEAGEMEDLVEFLKASAARQQGAP